MPNDRLVAAAAHAYQVLAGATDRPAILVAAPYGDLGAGLAALAQTPVEAIALDLEVVARLHIEPEPFGRAEVASQAEGGIRADGTGAVYDLVDATRGDADVLGQAVLREAERLEKVVREDFARMNRSKFTRGHEIS